MNENDQVYAHEILLPAGWKPPKGYSNGVVARGRLIEIGGQIGWNGNQEFESDDFVTQVETTLNNILAILHEAGASPCHLTRLTWYITDKQAYLANLKAIGAAYRKVMGRQFPPMTMVQVVALMEDRAKVEIEATAVIPD